MKNATAERLRTAKRYALALVKPGPFFKLLFGYAIILAAFCAGAWLQRGPHDVYTFMKDFDGVVGAVLATAAGYLSVLAIRDQVAFEAWQGKVEEYNVNTTLTLVIKNALDPYISHLREASTLLENYNKDPNRKNRDLLYDYVTDHFDLKPEIFSDQNLRVNLAPGDLRMFIEAERSISAVRQILLFEELDGTDEREKGIEACWAHIGFASAAVLMMTVNMPEPARPKFHILDVE
jgi:hypothetical protein